MIDRELPQPKTTVQTRYDDQLAAARAKLAAIGRKLDEHEARQKGDPNWPCVGDLGHVVEALTELEEFLG